MDIPDFFGLDIGHKIVKIAEVKRRGNAAQVRTVGSIALADDIVENASDIAMKAAAEKLKELRKSSGIGTNNCVIGIPEAPIFSRLLTLPKINNEELEQAVTWELKPLIPVGIEDVDIAFLEVGEKKVNDQVFVDIFAVAAPKSLTERYKTLAQMAGLNLLAIETKALAVSRIVQFNFQEEAKDVLIVQFDVTGTNLVLAKNGVPIFTQNVSTGAEALTKAIAADYGIDEQQAQQYRDAFGLDAQKGEGKIARTLQPIMQIVVTEITRTLTYLREKLGEGGADQIYICGEAAAVPGLSEYISAAIGIEAVLVDPVAKMKPGGKVKKDLEQLNPASFAVAIGLGIKDR